jgi:O-antigen/teichoic acid export membrane protein
LVFPGRPGYLPPMPSNPAGPGAPPLSLGKLGRFWLPLQATWLMMAVEGPFLAAVIARLPDPKFNLAAYGVAFSLAIMVEAPVIMMMSAATALVDSAGNYRRLRNFTWLLNAGITLVMLLLIFTPLWDLVIRRLMDLDPEVARLTRTALVILLPWPAAIGYRRFYQGLLIRTGRTRLVAWGTVVRLAAMVAATLAVRQTTGWPGAWVGACALTAGVLAEAVASRVMARSAVAELLAQPGEGVLGHGEIWRFYYPLALTSTISLVVHPMVTFFLGHSRNALESLAVMPVINSLVFIFRTPGLSFQEAAITMIGRSWDNLPQVKRFARLLGAGATVGLGLIALTPLSTLWFQTVSGLTPELTAFALFPVRILVLIPALSVLLSLQRSLQVAFRQTGPVTWASVTEVGGILLVLVLTLKWGDWVGATAAATALLAGRVGSNLYLAPILRREPPTS